MDHDKRPRQLTLFGEEPPRKWHSPDCLAAQESYRFEDGCANYHRVFTEALAQAEGIQDGMEVVGGE